MTYQSAILRRRVEAIFVYPVVWLGKLFSPFFSLKTKHRVFIFSPSADIGGSVKVNYDLCNCLSDLHPLVIFSKRPKNNEFLEYFKTSKARVIDIHRYVDYKWYHFVNIFYRGIVASWVNKSDNPIVIGGESLYFYKVLPHIKKSATRVDVCHLNTWFDYSQRFIPILDVRIFSTPKIKRDAEALYKKNELPQQYLDRLHFIDNKVNIPEYTETNNPKLSVVFIGRGAPQKRVHIIVAIAKKMHEMQSNVKFSFVGDVERVIEPNGYPYTKFYGNVKDQSRMDELYYSSDVLLLTSAYEGLPIAVMEMMAHGRVVVSTAVDGIPDYIQNGENGFLLNNNPDEQKIVEEAIAVLQQLAEDRELLHRVGRKSWLYAKEHFSGKTFCESYRNLLIKK